MKHLLLISAGKAFQKHNLYYSERDGNQACVYCALVGRTSAAAKRVRPPSSNGLSDGIGSQYFGCTLFFELSTGWCQVTARP